MDGARRHSEHWSHFVNAFADPAELLELRAGSRKSGIGAGFASGHPDEANDEGETTPSDVRGGRSGVIGFGHHG